MKRLVGLIILSSLCSVALSASPKPTKFEADLEAKREHIKKIIKTCHEQIKDSDINGRNLLPEVLTDMGGAEEGLEFCSPLKPTVRPAQNMQSFMEDVNKTMLTFNNGKVWDEATKIALDKAIRASLSIHSRFANEIQDVSEARAVICKKLTHFCKPGHKGPEAAVIDHAVKQFLHDKKNLPIALLKGGEEEKIKNEFNAIIKSTNTVCATIKKEYLIIGQERKLGCLVSLEGEECVNTKNVKNWVKPLKCFKKTLPSETRSDPCLGETLAANQKYQGNRERAVKAFEAEQKKLFSTQLGQFFPSESFREHVGLANPGKTYEACVRPESNGVYKQVWHEQIKAAKSEIYYLVLAELEKIEKKRLDKSPDVEKELRIYLKNNPQTIADLLNKNPDPNTAKAICSHAKTIHRRDKAEAFIDTSAMVIGTAAGVGFTIATWGAGLAVTAPLAAALSGVGLATSTYVAAKAVHDVNYISKEIDRTAGAVLTNQRSTASGVSSLIGNDTKHDEKLVDAAWSVGGMVVEGALLYHGFKTAVDATKALQKNPTLYHMVEGATPVKKTTTLAKGAKLYNEALKAMAGKVGELKKLSDLQKTQIAAILTKFDAVNAKLIVGQLARLDPDQLKNFFTALEGVSDGALSEKGLLAMIDQFSKSGAHVSVEALAKLSPLVPKDPIKVAAIYPKATTVIKEVLPKATPDEVQKIIQFARTKNEGLIKDSEIADLITYFSRQGAKSSSDVLKRFHKLDALKQKYSSFFGKNGVMNLEGIDDEAETVKLAYLENIDQKGLIIRDHSGAPMFNKDGEPLRKLWDKVRAEEKLEAIKKDIQAMAKRPCSL